MNGVVYSQAEQTDSVQLNDYSKNLFMVHLDDQHIGASYMRKIGKYWGINAAFHHKTSEVGYVTHGSDLPTSFYSGENAKGLPYIGSKEPELFHPNALNRSITYESYSFMQGVIGVFAEKENVLLKNLDIRLLANINLLKVNSIREDAAISSYSVEGTDGEVYQFYNPFFTFERYYTNPFFSLEAQVNYSFYKKLFLGLNVVVLNQTPTNRYGVIATASLGIKF